MILHCGNEFEAMTTNDLKHHLKKIERQKLHLQSELRDCEWRLDQESTVSVYSL